MTRTFMGSAIAVLALAALFPLAGRTYGGDEAQVWNEMKVTAKWTSQVDLFAAAALRLEEDFPVLNRASLQLGLNLRPTPWLTFSPNYQYIVNDPADDVRKHEHRPGLVTAARIPIQRAEVTLSTGVEYRFREENADSWRVRPKLKLKYPLGPDQWTLSGYLADELFYDTSANDFVRNRFFAGFEKKLGSNWSVDFYYCRQHDLQAREPDLDIIGLSMALRLDMRRAEAQPPPTGK